MIIFHNYRMKEAVDKLRKILLNLLNQTAIFIGKSTANMIVLTHRPDIGVKINELIGYLKTSSNKFDQNYWYSLLFWNGLKDIPIFLFLFLFLEKGLVNPLCRNTKRRMTIKEWGLEAFKTAFEIIDSKLHRDSQWALDGKNLVYTVRKCSIARPEDDPNKCICHTIRETFIGQWIMLSVIKQYWMFKTIISWW